MIAKATVYLTGDRTTAVPLGDPRARFKLVHVGQEITEAEVARYEGAAELLGGEDKRKSPPQEKLGNIETREPKPEHRDPSFLLGGGAAKKHAKRKGK